jgi:D-serine deaminase-like pyridoxal phosphate-dependent protein
MSDTVARPRIPLPVAEMETPALVVDLEIVRANVAAMQHHADEAGVALRPHVKTHKSVGLGRLQLEAGARGITTGTIGEAEVFAAAGFDDIFLAYPVWAGGAAGHRLRALHESVSLRVGIDTRPAADALAAAMRHSSRRAAVVVEVDCGARRCGVEPAAAGELARYARSIGLDPLGVYTYPGHGDRDVTARSTASDDEIEALTTALSAMRDVGIEPIVASGGSTPTSGFSARVPLTELRPGEYIFNDLGKLRLGACGPNDIGLFVATRVVSDAVDGQVILDAGTKVLGREGSDSLGYGMIPAFPDSFLRRLNEYHGYLAIPPNSERPRVGEIVALVPNHVCPAVNLFDDFVVREMGEVLGRWPVDARGYATKMPLA